MQLVTEKTSTKNLDQTAVHKDKDKLEAPSEKNLLLSLESAEKLCAEYAQGHAWEQFLQSTQIGAVDCGWCDTFQLFQKVG